MRPALKKLHLVLLVLFSLSFSLHAQSEKEQWTAHLEKELAETRRLAASTAIKDRMQALLRLNELNDMDYDLLWKLMNDTDMEVRIAAIGALRFYFCTTPVPPPLPAALAQKMVAMLEKEVAQKRIKDAFEPGHVKELPACLVLSSALTLNHLYEYHFFTGVAYDYSLWQQRVLQPLGFAMGSQSRDMDEGLEGGFMGDLYNAISDPAALMEVLHASMKSLDDPSLPPDRLQERLRVLWSHPLLGKDGPLNLMLVAQLSPRLGQLVPRILSPMKEGFNKQHTERFMNEITEAVLTAREKLACSAGKTRGDEAP